MSLKAYKQKRQFSKTPEPVGKIHTITSPIFVVQKHAASHLHYDFRLAINGVLKSWAVPKGPCLDPSVKRLAVEVEDHPLEYAQFEGIIPRGQYGGGTVMIWDFGVWESSDEIAKAYRKGAIKFKLHGKKLNGEWNLVRTHTVKSQKPQWLLIKARDNYSKKLKEFDIVEAMPNSVLSGRNMDNIAHSSTCIWNEKTKKSLQNNKPKVLTKLPMNFKPELATLVDSIPVGDEWLHEVKFDGYRILAFFANEKIRLITRNGLDYTHKFPTIVQELKKLKLDLSILDGELVVLNQQGLSDFQALQNALEENTKANFHYYIFDIPIHNGLDLCNTRLLERKAILANILQRKKSSLVHYSEHIKGHADELITQACEQQLEGIVSKRTESVYKQARTEDWVKTKCSQRQEFIIVGYTKPKGNRQHFGSLLLGYYNDQQKLVYCGHVGTGFTEKSLSELFKKMSKITQENSALDVLPPVSMRKEVQWLKPTLIAEVVFSSWTNEGNLRHPSYKGLRVDKASRDINLEKTKKIKSKNSTMVRNISTLTAKISHPDKILYADEGITKLELANYYLDVSEKLLPHVVNRPLSLVRCPKEGTNQCFYQKHWSKSMPAGIKPIQVKQKSGKADYVMITQQQGLIAIAQMDILEIHPWGSRSDKLDYPDRIVIDLDPSAEIEWQQLVEAALLVRDALQAIELISFAKLTGGKGIHLVIPVMRSKSFPEIKIFTKGFAIQLAKNFPQLFIANMNKQKRQSKIFVDYLRNEYGATAIAPFSPRAKPHATTAVPISWKKLEHSREMPVYTIKTLAQYWQDYPQDPWRELTTIRQNLSKKHLKIFDK